MARIDRSPTRKESNMTAHDLQTVAADVPEDGNEVLLSSISLFICW